MGGIIIG